MNIYLLTFKQGSKVVHAWHESDNAGEPVNMLEDKGIEVIKTMRLKNSFIIESIMKNLPDLTFWVRLMESDLRYKELQNSNPALREGLTKIEL